MNLTVPTEAETTMTATGPFRHMCPFVDEVDNGTITITWQTRGKTFELHALRAYLDTFRDLRISHEELTQNIKAHLTNQAGVLNVHVETAWDTAGMEVKCST